MSPCPSHEARTSGSSMSASQGNAARPCSNCRRRTALPYGLVPKTELLSHIPLFAGLRENEIAALAQRAVERRFTAGEMLFWEDEPCAGIFLIAEGSVKIFKTSSGGRELMLGRRQERS